MPVIVSSHGSLTQTPAEMLALKPDSCLLKSGCFLSKHTMWLVCLHSVSWKTGETEAAIVTSFRTHPNDKRKQNKYWTPNDQLFWLTIIMYRYNQRTMYCVQCIVGNKSSWYIFHVKRDLPISILTNYLSTYHFMIYNHDSVSTQWQDKGCQYLSLDCFVLS